MVDIVDLAFHSVPVCVGGGGDDGVHEHRLGAFTTCTRVAAAGQGRLCRQRRQRKRGAKPRQRRRQRFRPCNTPSPEIVVTYSRTTAFTHRPRGQKREAPAKDSATS